MSMITVETLCTLLKYALERMKHQGVSDQLSVHTTDSKCVAAISKVIYCVLGHTNILYTSRLILCNMIFGHILYAYCMWLFLQ